MDGIVQAGVRDWGEEVIPIFNVMGGTCEHGGRIHFGIESPTSGTIPTCTGACKGKQHTLPLVSLLSTNKFGKTSIDGQVPF